MGVLKDIERVIGRAKTQAANTSASEMHLIESMGSEPSGELFHADNLKLMKAMSLNDKYKGKISMIYIDPPFFTEAKYDAVLIAGDENIKHYAYNDKWEQGMYEYLRQLTARLIYMKELLADDGLIFLHLDWHAVHYAKIIMDEIFGEKNFVNEIIWTYKSGGASKSRFARKHDNILIYSKTKKYKFYPLKEKSYNRGFKPYRFKGVEEFEDSLGWYTMVNMKDVWNIDMVGRTSAERTGYATQKPEALIERIISCCTEEGDLVADFFCGSGTLPAVAAKTGRRFIGCDVGTLAIESTVKRLAAIGAGVNIYSTHELSELMTKKALPDFDAEVNLTEEELLTGKHNLKLEISKIHERRLSKQMDDNAKKALEKLIKNDPLSLISFWSVDFNFRGNVFSHDEIFARKGKDLPLSFEKFMEKSYGKICVKLVDAMGRSIYKIIEQK